MSVRSKWLFIFLGNNYSGKTTIQKWLVEFLTGRTYTRLPSNTAHAITHDYIIRKFRKIFVAGRSYQELRVAKKQSPSEYSTVEEYFELLDQAGSDVDIAFMASHLDMSDIESMIEQAQRRFWNVCGIFLSNSIASKPALNADISANLGWDERWLVENPAVDDETAQTEQLKKAADTILQMLIDRTRGWS